MDYTLEDKVISRTQAQKALERFKKNEEKINFHSKRLNKNTIVFCKNKDRIKDFENSYNNIKNW